MMWRLAVFDSSSRVLPQFARVAIFALTLLAYVVSATLQINVTQSAAKDSASAADLMVAPFVQEFAIAQALSPESVHKLAIFQKTALADRTSVPAIRLQYGKPVHSDDKRRFDAKFSALQIDEADSGKRTATFEISRDARRSLVNLKHPILNIYAPLTRTATQEITTTAAIYRVDGRLASTLGAA
jgi:hypothetical protein